MNKILLTIIAAAFALTSYAQSYSYLTVTRQNGAEESHSLTGLKITYGASEMLLESQGKTYTFPLTDLRKMNFTQNPTAIASVAIDKPAIVNQGDRLAITATRSGKMRVYSADGKLITTANVSAGKNDLDISRLPKGIYIINLLGESAKIEKK